MSYRDAIHDALQGNGADYCEIRIEETASTRLVYRGKGLEDAVQSSGRGGNVRACVRGGWGFVSFNNLEGLKARVKQAVAQARAVGGEGTKLAEVEPNVRTVKPRIVNDPRVVPLAEKKRRMDHYNGLLLSTPQVQSINSVYAEGSRHVFFGNSDGAYMDQEFIHVTCRLAAQAKRDNDIQEAGFSIGSLGDFALLDGLDDEVKAVGQRAVDLLSARPLKGGERTVILNPVLAGVFIHEAFGHLSEGDNVAEDKKLQEIMVMGRKFGGKHLNVTDGAAMPGLRGSFAFDDEGTPATKTPLIREGVLVGRLHSRETAAMLGEKPTGNARAVGYNFPPIVRMTNTVIENDKAKFEDLIADVKEGVYVRGWYGGMTQHEMFTFSSGEAHMVRNGKIAEMVRPVMLSGNLFTTLENIDAIGNDIGMNEGGGCGKSGQSPLPVSLGSPHIRIRKCLISGA
ncbi:MAG: TldD/PmbA family protein [Dehalococcoidia bacterium]|nr:TldD/PmbA family protein [Dehalococcoidia bacterium]MSQ34619.1 TldD/PmbA family protein [Dehalococcoidia bacterium]